MMSRAATAIALAVALPAIAERPVVQATVTGDASVRTRTDLLKKIRPPLDRGIEQVRYFDVRWSATERPAATLRVDVGPADSMMWATITATSNDAAAAGRPVERKVLVFPASQYLAYIRDAIKRRAPAETTIYPDEQDDLAANIVLALELAGIPVATAMSVEPPKASSFTVPIEYQFVAGLLLHGRVRRAIDAGDALVFRLVPQNAAANGATALTATAPDRTPLTTQQWSIVQSRDRTKDRVYVAGPLPDERHVSSPEPLK